MACSPCGSTDHIAGIYSSQAQIVFKNGRSIPRNHLIIAKNGEVISSLMPTLKLGNYSQIGTACPDHADPGSVALVTSSNNSMWMGRHLEFTPDFRQFTIHRSIIETDSPLGAETTYIRVDTDH